jgi:TRAP-type C4-dicarboxylate transport system substrate-binding protein
MKIYLITQKFKSYFFILFVIFFNISLIDSVCGNDIIYVDPWQLKQYMKGNREPPDNLKILFRVVTVAPEGSGWYNFITQDLFNGIGKISNGLIVGKLYPGGVLGDEADTIRKMQMKQIHGIGVTNMGATMMVPELCVLELPFLFDYEPELFWNQKYTQIDYVLEKVEPSFAKLAIKHGYQFGGMAETCLNFIGTKSIRIEKAEDLKKTKFWLWRGDRIREDVIDRMGFGSVLSTDLYNVSQAMSTGMVDTTWVGYNPAVLLQWWPHINYVTDYPIFGYESATAFFEKEMIEAIFEFALKWGDKYNINTQTLRKDFIGMLDTLITRKMRMMIRRDEGKARKGLLDQGVKEVHLNESELDKLRVRVEPLYNELADKKYPKALLEEILVYRNEYRELKKQGKLTEEWYTNGILPEGNQHDEWHEW